MSLLKIQNNQSFRLEEIVFLDKNSFFVAVSELLSDNLRMIGLFPPDSRFPNRIIAVLGNPNESLIYIVGGEFDSNKLEFESFAVSFPQTSYFECELAENYGYRPLNHPWLRPVRKQNVISGDKPYEFYKISGDEVHEVAVGPIHAGVIEPGHFRFQCHGERVYNLEINLGYQHRGVEAMFPDSEPNRRIMLAESIAGDSVVANVSAHCHAIESLSDTQVSLRAQVIRAIAEELERTAMHIASLGGIANDIGLAIASASYGRLRTLVINSLADLSGSRFGRGLFICGGVRFDFNDRNIRSIIEKLTVVRNDINAINDFLFSSTGALVRFEKTGTVPLELAAQSGLVGLAARACGIGLDTRVDFPYGAYRYFPVLPMTLYSGDVYARARIRALEIEESLRFVFEQIESLPEGEIKSNGSHEFERSSGVVSVTEGFRGEIVHIAITDENGKIAQYKIKDPSFNNWYGLSLALRKTEISDFPLCNKSFDLSYAGHDL